MSSPESNQKKKDETILENSTYNILMALGKESDFLYSPLINTYRTPKKTEEDIW